MYKAILIDDNELNSKFLHNLLETYAPEISVIGSSTSVAEAILKIRQFEELIIFLDVELGTSENGFDLISLLEGRNDKIIIVSAFPEYAVQAFRTKTIDFLKKPVRISELRQAVDRVLNQYNIPIGTNIPVTHNQIVIHQFNKSTLVNEDEIIFIKSELSKSYVFLNDGTCLNSIESIGKFESRLNTVNFVRVHNSYLVNIHEIKVYYNENTSLFLEMSNQQTVPVSRRNKGLLRDIYKK